MAASRPSSVDSIARTSLEFIGNTAFVVTLTGKVLRIDNISGHDDDDD